MISKLFLKFRDLAQEIMGDECFWTLIMSVTGNLVLYVSTNYDVDEDGSLIPSVDDS